MSTNGVSSVSAYYQTSNLTQAELEEAIKKAKDAEEKAKAEAAQSKKPAKTVTVPLGSSAPEQIGDLTDFTTKSDTQTEQPKVSEKIAKFRKLSPEEQAQKIHKLAEDIKADANRLGELANEPIMQEWRKRTKDRPDVETAWNKLKASGKASEEIGETFKEAELRDIKEDAAFLREQFEKNPELREKLQTNFDKLSRSEQKALLYEFYTSDRKEGRNEETDRLMKGLKGASDEVKSLAVAGLRRNKERNKGLGKGVTEEQYQAVLKELNLMEKDIVGRLPEKSAPEQVLIGGNIANDENSVARTEYVENIHECADDAQDYMLKTITESKYMKNDESAKTAYAKSVPKFQGEHQVKAAKYAIDSDNFNSKDRDKVIKEIKNFEDKENQKTVANYVTDSDKVDENNRITMSKEIKNLHKDVQADVAKHFSESEKNTQSEKVMEQFKKDINNLKIKEEEKAALQKRVQEAEAQRAAEAKKTADAQAKAQEQARVEAEKVAKAEQEAKEKELKELEKLTKHASKGAQIQDAGLAQLVQSKMQKQTANPFFVQAQVRPTTFADLTNCINNGTLSFGEMQAAGYGNYAIACMNDLNMDKQDELIDSVDNKTIAYMHQKGLLPSRLNKQILARISSSTVDEHTARYAANQADSSNDIIAMYEAQKDSRNKEAISEVFQKRYSQSYEDYFKKKNGGFGTFSSLA